MIDYKALAENLARGNADIQKEYSRIFPISKNVKRTSSWQKRREDYLKEMYLEERRHRLHFFDWLEDEARAIREWDDYEETKRTAWADAKGGSKYSYPY